MSDYRYQASKASVEGEATIICGGPCGAVAPPMPPHPALAPAKPDARFGFAGGGGDASPYNRIAAIGEKDLIIGFSCLGVDLIPVQSKTDTETALRRISQERELALVLITETAAELCRDIIPDLREKSLAVILIIPSHEGSRGISMTEMRRGIERAVGINILDKRKEI